MNRPSTPRTDTPASGTQSSVLSPQCSAPVRARRLTRFGSFAALTAVLLLVAGLFATDSPKPAQPAPAAPGTAQDLIFFTGDGPVRVRVSVTIAGRPAEEVWRAALDALFGYCDRNGDGSLDANERQAFQSGRRGSQYVIIDGTGYLINQPQRVAFTEKNGKVDRAAFQDGFRNSGLRPVAANGVAPRGDSQQLTDALFKYLDTDKDGKLSVEELKAARQRLAALDVNEDEMITADELISRVQNPYFEAVQLLEVDGAGPVQQVQIADVFMPASGRPVSVKDLLAQRDKDGDGALSAAELGCDAKTFAELDADGDGRLDADELAAWLRQPPALELTIDLTDRAMPDGLPRVAPGVLRVSGNGQFAGRVKTERDGSIGLALTDVRFRFAADAGSGLRVRSQWDATVQNVRSSFKSLSAETGTVERQKIAQSPELAGFLPLFDFADRDGDGKVTTAELDRVVQALSGAVNCRATVSVSDSGRGL
ncbi:MAG TPA: EF-hand domain-containing protein, partial [Gemmataceae bacterium]|nr:EF-hand domain-containing protein [Gemmataceae bacterium]